MPDDMAQQAATPTPSHTWPGMPRQRDPVIFNASDEQDAEDWLSQYEIVSAHNKWDEADKLGYLHFYLAGVAQLWFNNHQADIPNWSSFKTRFAEVFGRPAVRKLRAEQRLRGRAQRSRETFTSYIEDVVDLCRRINPDMSDTDKIRHIMKGIEDDAFHMLVAKNPQTVAEVTQYCQSYDELRRQRISTRHPSFDTATTSALTVGAVSTEETSLMQQIQQFVREEVARQLSIVPYIPASAHTLTPTLRKAIEEQVSDALPSTYHHSPTSAPLTYAEVARRPSLSLPLGTDPARQANAFYAARPPVRPDPPPFHRPAPPSSNPWRTPDNRPICYSCRLPGHVARFCRRRDFRQGASEEGYGYYRTEPPQSSCSHPTSDTSSSNRRGFDRHRSPSPRRRSISPMVRRPPPVPAEN